LRQDSRVVVMEQTDVRQVTPKDFGGQCPWLVCDVSFISLSRLIPYLLPLAQNFLLLVKPQFELAREEVPKGGVVSNPQLIDKAVAEVRKVLTQHGAKVKATQSSQVLGREGNQEVFLWGERK